MRSIKLGRILGIPIALDISWFLSLSWVLFVLGSSVYPDVLPEESALVHWTLAAVTGLIFFACILLHELGHSVVARYYDIPVKSITLFILGGVAQITRDARKPLQELLMALAGPSVSILLGGVFMVLWLVTGRDDSAISAMFFWLWITNIFLGVFNLTPAFPMDGGRVLRASLWGITHNFVRATRIAVLVGRGLAALLMGYGFLSAFVGTMVARSDFPGVGAISGVWLALIGFFLWQNASASLRQAQQVHALEKVRVADVMVSDIPSVFASTTVREMLGGPLSGYGQGRDWLFVSGGQNFAGVTPRAAVLRVPEPEWDTRVAADLMIPATRLHAVAPDATLADVYQQLQEHDAHVFPVVSDGQVIGLIHEGHVGRALRATEQAA